MVYLAQDSSDVYVNFLLAMCLLQISTYEKEVEEMKNMTRQEYVASLRR